MQEAGAVVMQVTYAGNTTIPHGTVSGNPLGSLTLASGEQLVSLFGTSSNYVTPWDSTPTEASDMGPGVITRKEPHTHSLVL
jgi:hypothetical protein